MSTRPILDLPKHQNPWVDPADPSKGWRPDRTACAPYNFIPLPDKVITVKGTLDEQLPDHDRYHDGLHTGYFAVTLETKSPLYVRCGLSAARPHENTPSEFEKAEAEKLGKMPSNFREAMKNKPDFFYTRDRNEPVIPGSSLCGMLRSVLETASYGKVERVAKKKLVFRDVNHPAYRARMAGGTGKKGNGYHANVEAGFVRKGPNDK
jgi:CRISPR-associated protein (TIGR03986 family)